MGSQKSLRLLDRSETPGCLTTHPSLGEKILDISVAVTTRLLPRA
jgi:hypothetical protein